MVLICPHMVFSHLSFVYNLLLHSSFGFLPLVLGLVSPEIFM